MIRRATTADLAELVRIRTAVAENHLSEEQMAEIGITPSSIAADMHDGHLACWVAVEDGAIVGFSMAEGRDASVFALFMAAAQEGKGHGSALLAACEDWLRNGGHAMARLSTGRDTRAFHFYLRRGWQETDETAGHFAEDAVLVKTLRQSAGPQFG